MPAPWICFLYAVLSLTTQTRDLSSQSGNSIPNSRRGGEPPTPADFISRARSLLKDVLDETDLDSSRALCAMVRIKQIYLLLFETNRLINLLRIEHFHVQRRIPYTVVSINWYCDQDCLHTRLASTSVLPCNGACKQGSRFADCLDAISGRK